MTLGGKQNPRIREVEVGTRTLKSIKVYPLSVGDELEVSDLISETLTQFFAQKVEDVNKKVIDFFIDTVQKNLKRALELVTDGAELKLAGFETFDSFLKDIDNEQLVEILEIIYKNNFERIAKNLKGSLGTILGMFQEKEALSREPLPESATFTQDTDSSTSTSEDIKKEE
jgi:hypothetical protein